MVLNSTLKFSSSKINWDNLSQGKPVIFHGDFHFENIIYNTKQDKFYFGLETRLQWDYRLW